MAPKISLPSRRGDAASAGIPRSQGEQLWLVAGALGALLVLVIGWFFVLSPQRSDTSGVRSKVTAAKQQNATLQSQISSLQAATKNLSRYQTLLHQAQQALPTADQMSTFLRTLSQLGTLTHTTVTSVSASTPTVVSSGSSSSAAPASAGASSSTPAPAAAGAAPAAAAGPQLYSITINLTVTGAPADLTQFLQQVQLVQPRAVLITNVAQDSTLDQAAGGSPTKLGATTMTLTMNAFEAPTNITQPVGAVPSPSASSSGSGS